MAYNRKKIVKKLREEGRQAFLAGKNRQRQARLLKTNVLFTVPGQKRGEFYKLPHRGKPTECQAFITSKYPGAAFIEG